MLRILFKILLLKVTYEHAILRVLEVQDYPVCKWTGSWAGNWSE